MTKKLLKPMLTLGVVSVLAFAAASTSFGQTRSAGTHQCWIPTNDDMGVGYWGDCSVRGSRPVK
jgi:hypothetical protein